MAEAFVRAATEQRQIVENADRAAVKSLFEEVRGFFGPFTEAALDQSSFLIDRLVERDVKKDLPRFFPV